jgi:biotin operon repressor
MSHEPVQIAWGSPVRLNASHHGEWRKAMMRDTHLSAGARLVGCVLVEGINWGRTTRHKHLAGLTWQTQEQIGAEIGMSDRQVRRCIESLEDRGWIATAQRALGRASTARLMWPKLAFDRTSASAQRKVKTNTPRAVTGQFVAALPDIHVLSDRTLVTGNHLEDHLEDHLDARRMQLDGVSEEAWEAYRAARATGSPEAARAALRRMMREHDAGPIRKPR